MILTNQSSRPTFSPTVRVMLHGSFGLNWAWERRDTDANNDLYWQTFEQLPRIFGIVYFPRPYLSPPFFSRFVWQIFPLLSMIVANTSPSCFLWASFWVLVRIVQKCLLISNFQINCCWFPCQHRAMTTDQVIASATFQCSNVVAKSTTIQCSWEKYTYTHCNVTIASQIVDCCFSSGFFCIALYTPLCLLSC